MNDVKKIVILSTVTALMLGSNAYAGKITGVDAGTPYDHADPLTQYGFGGWNLDNINVKMVDVATGDELAGSSYDPSDGTYSTMMDGESFTSEIENNESIVVGELHGKDWPVGEPAGIKIVNDDNSHHGKPGNCIMTTSYLGDSNTSDADDTTYYLNDANPDPVLCSSPFQSHKRYKINMLPASVANIADVDATTSVGGYGKGIELVFDLNITDITNRSYQVLQKINNYTDKRLSGYKVEVFDANGDKNDAVTLSLGEGLDEGENIWDPEDMANMSHGLWGPADDHFDENGFFDDERAHYTVALSDNNRTISYIGPMMGGNYQDIFGNWLPSKWEPEGIFHDDDEDPATDGVLKAFYGVAPGETELAWWKSTPSSQGNPDYIWEKATEDDLASWEGEWYSEGAIEDVLNLGLNYIINIGNNADLGGKIILRVTPHVDTNQTPPSSFDTNAMDSSYNFEAAADFNADSLDDILWKNPSTGVIVIWYMNSDGTHVEKEIGVSDLKYNIEGVANFNDDNIADILWKDPVTGQITIWYMDINGTYVETEIFTSATTYSIEAVANFNDDNIADIVFRNRSTGRMGIEYIYSDGSHDWKFVLSSNPDYSVEAAANFNDDNIADILFKKRSTGRIGIQYINSDGSSSWKFILSSNINYSVEAAADFNDDNIADILFRNRSTGRTGIQYVNSDGSSSWKFIDSSLGVAYNIEAAAIFNDTDTINDIFWRDPSTGKNIIWYMNSDGSHN